MLDVLCNKHTLTVHIVLPDCANGLPFQLDCLISTVIL